MEFEKILEKENYALILRGSEKEEYAVVYGLDEEKGVWDWTVSEYNFSKYTTLDKAVALSLAIDCFRTKTEPDYISRCRLEEIVNQFKDVKIV